MSQLPLINTKSLAGARAVNAARREKLTLPYRPPVVTKSKAAKWLEEKREFEIQHQLITGDPFNKPIFQKRCPEYGTLPFLNRISERRFTVECGEQVVGRGCHRRTLECASSEAAVDAWNAMVLLES